MINPNDHGDEIILKNEAYFIKAPVFKIEKFHKYAMMEKNDLYWRDFFEGRSNRL